MALRSLYYLFYKCLLIICLSYTFQSLIPYYLGKIYCLIQIHGFLELPHHTQHPSFLSLMAFLYIALFLVLYYFVYHQSISSWEFHKPYYQRNLLHLPLLYFGYFLFLLLYIQLCCMVLHHVSPSLPQYLFLLYLSLYILLIILILTLTLIL